MITGHNPFLYEQITVRSSPIIKKFDKLSVCRHCHKNCKQRANSSKTSSLKVQHSQSSSSRCCASTNSSQGSGKSTPSHSSRSKEQSPNDDQTTYYQSKTRNDNKSCEGSPASQKTITTTTCSNANALNNNILCKCKCTAADFQNIVRTPHEIRKEKCKLLNSVSELQAAQSVTRNWIHSSCQVKPIRESKIQNLNENEFIVSTSEISNVDDWSNKLIGLTQFRPVPNIAQETQDPFKAVPKISVVPPTPDGLPIIQRISQSQPWERLSSEQSEDSPLDELPYRSLKRYGTVSSLEKMPSDETDDKTGNSSGTETNEEDEGNTGKLLNIVNAYYFMKILIFFCYSIERN